MTEDDKAFLAQVALGWFQVRPDGTIWRYAEFVGGGIPRLRTIPHRRAEKSRSARGGYLRVMFLDSTVRRKVSAHRIVWMMINQRDIPAGMEINHKDGNKQNNAPSNLEVVTRKQNVKHSFEHLPRKKKAQRGILNASAILTEGQVIEIRMLWAARAMTQQEIASRFKIKQTTISNIVTKKTWTHLP